MPRQPEDTHPSAAELLLATEGELSADDLARVRLHLRTCTQCQHVVSEVDQTVGLYTDRLRDADLHAVPPAVLHDFQRELTSVARRSREKYGRIPSRIWLRVAAVVPLTIGLILFNGFAPTLKANELLDRASAAEARGTLDTQTPAIRVRLTAAADRGDRAGLVFVRQADNTLVPALRGAGLDGLDRPEAEQTLAALFTRAGLDWRAPLSVRGFRTWRDTLTSKRDRVAEANQDITIETSTEQGTIREGRLHLSGATLHPTRVQWRLADNNRIEIEAIDAAALTHNAPAAIEPTPIARTLISHTLQPTDAELDHAEVEVRAALHRDGADVAQDLAIARTSDRRVAVTGIVDSAERKASLVSSLASVTNAHISVRAADEVDLEDLPTDAPLLMTQHDARPALLASWLEQAFPDESSRQAFGATALSLAREIHARALAQERLRARYPAAQLTRLDARDRETVRALMRDNDIRLSASLQALEQHLAPVLREPLLEQPAAAATSGDDEGRARINSVTRTQRIEHAVFALFADVQTSGADNGHDLPHLLANLQHDLRDGQRP